MHTKKDADCLRALRKHVDRLVPVALRNSGLDKEVTAPPAGFDYAGQQDSIKRQGPNPCERGIL
jgi:hypothetical protein